jgi:hypothetical protein
MSRLKLQLRVTKALASAGATDEILALANSAFEACLKPKPNGRPPKYANRSEQQRAYRARRKERDRIADLDREDRRLAREGGEASGGNSDPLADFEPIRRLLSSPTLKGLLVDAARWNVDREADVSRANRLW